MEIRIIEVLLYFERLYSLEIILLDDTVCITYYFQGHIRSRWSGWSGFGRTTFSQGKNKVAFYREQVINKVLG